MLTIEQSWVASGAQGLRILSPEDSWEERPTAHFVLVFHCGSKVSTMLIKGEEQFEELLYCMSMFAEYMVRCGDRGIPKAEYLDIGHARLAAAVLNGEGSQNYTLALGIFDETDKLFEDGSRPVRHSVTSLAMTMSQAQIRAFGKVFKKIDSCEVQPVFEVDTEEWFDLPALTDPKCDEDRARADLVFKSGRRARA